MIHLRRNVDLAPRLQGWETAVANAFDVAFFTANWIAGFSVDDGKIFRGASPDDVCKVFKLKFCCDQGVTYVPRINSFVWIVLADEGPIIMAVASPDEIRNSKGRIWTLYLIPPSAFRWENEAFDYPDVSFGDNFLYLTANLIQRGGAVIIRLPLVDIAARGTITAGFKHYTDSAYICPVQLTGERGWFGAMQDPNHLRVFSWSEMSGSPAPSFDVPIATVPTQDWSSFTPDGDDWLPLASKIDTAVTGAARSGRELWFAWSAARKVEGRKENAMPQPHIELAVVNLQSKKLVKQRYIWNARFAFAWPSLASNPAQQVAMSFAWGGGRVFFPQHAVGLLSPREDFVSTTTGATLESGGHYNRARLAFPRVDEFVAGGWVRLKEKKKAVDHPHYVVFSG